MSVLDANGAFYRAVEQADVDAMAAVWDDGDVSCVHPGHPAIRGRGPVLRSWSAVMAGTGSIHFLLTEVTVAEEGDTAVVTCTENILSRGADGGDAVGAVVATNVFRRRAGGWRLAVHHASPLLVEP